MCATDLHHIYRIGRQVDIMARMRVVRALRAMRAKRPKKRNKRLALYAWLCSLLLIRELREVIVRL